MANVVLDKKCRVCGACPAEYYPSKAKRQDYICVSCAKKETCANRGKKVVGYCDTSKMMSGTIWDNFDWSKDAK